jgi:hypothetical protein
MNTDTVVVNANMRPNDCQGYLVERAVHRGYEWKNRWSHRRALALSVMLLRLLKVVKRNIGIDLPSFVKKSIDVTIRE